MSEKCLVCNFDNHVEEAEYCQNCGASLINFCSNDFCDLNNGDNSPLNSQAHYCPYCGSPSLFKESGYFDEE